MFKNIIRISIRKIQSSLLTYWHLLMLCLCYCATLLDWYFLLLFSHRDHEAIPVFQADVSCIYFASACTAHRLLSFNYVE